MYEMMERAYHESNARINNETYSKIYNYKLLGEDFQTVLEKGRCTKVSRSYDSINDYNVISFTDIDTGKKHSVCQFYVTLKEIK